MNVLATQGSLYDYNTGGYDYTYIGATSSSFDTGTGSTASINGYVDAFGAGSTYLYVDDSADTTGRNVTMNNGSMTGLSPGTIYWSPSSSSTAG